MTWVIAAGIITLSTLAAIPLGRRLRRIRLTTTIPYPPKHPGEVWGIDDGASIRAVTMPIGTFG